MAAWCSSGIAGAFEFLDLVAEQGGFLEFQIVRGFDHFGFEFADGFGHIETSLIQTAGRAARHLNGEVILYADVMTDSIKKFLAVTEYRRKRQIEYNTKHNITPRSVKRAVEESLSSVAHQADSKAIAVLRDAGVDFDVAETIRELESEMIEASNNLEFEKAALLRDQVKELKRTSEGANVAGGDAPVKSVSYKKKRGKR